MCACMHACMCVFCVCVCVCVCVCKCMLFTGVCYISFMFTLQLEEEPFNPDYVEVDRVLDMSIGVDQNTGEVRNPFLLDSKCMYNVSQV